MNRGLRTASVCIIALFFIYGCNPKDRRLSLVISTEEPAQSIAEKVRENLIDSGYSIDIESAADGGDILLSVKEGRTDLAIVEEPDQPLAGIKTIAPLYPSVLHILYNGAEIPVNLTELLRGAHVYAGPAGGAAYRLLMQLAADFGIAADEFQILDNPWTVTPDVYFIFGGLLSAQSVLQLEGYRLFGFAQKDDIDGASVADAIALRHHHFRPFLLPRGIYNTLSDDAVLTLSTRSLLVAHEDFDSELAYDIAAALFTGAQDISLAYPLVTQELNEDLQFGDLMLPLHAGSRRYLDRYRPGFIERNVEVIALYLTIFLAALSGMVALYRHRIQVRKDRVDTYFVQLLEIRNDMRSESADCSACKTRVLDVQRAVLDLLVDERIAADSSLIAFISLSNQIIDELDRKPK